MVLLYIPDYQNEPESIEHLLSWSDFIKKRCSGLIDTENQTPEEHETLPIQGNGYQGRWEIRWVIHRLRRLAHHVLSIEN